MSVNIQMSICVNIKINVLTRQEIMCSCPKGYHDDGRIDGNGCTADQFLVIQLVVGFAVSGTVVLVSSSWLFWIFRKRKLIKLREQFFRQNGGLMLQQLSRQDKPT
ncbi:hypothetical protein ACSBR1_001260 [Camellia fascicularis]